jgi:hypothetical protein
VGWLQRIHISGTSGQADSYAAWYLPFSGYVIQAGDRIHRRQYQSAAKGGIGISFVGGGNTNWSTHDTDGDAMNSDPTEGSWHQRTVDLTPFAGKTVDKLWITADSGTPVGNWVILYGDISIVHPDGTVTTAGIAKPGDRAKSESFSYFSGGGETNPHAWIEHKTTSGNQPAVTTSYYLADQIGSIRMVLSAGGWPVAGGTYYPFGVEIGSSAKPVSPLKPTRSTHFVRSGWA